jgi:maltose O-acetyltransferase
VAILGSSTIEPYCLIGSNATITDGGVIIARECIIGAGSLISKNTRERGVYIGNPAKLAPKKSNEMSTWLTWGVK